MTAEMSHVVKQLIDWPYYDGGRAPIVTCELNEGIIMENTVEAKYNAPTPTSGNDEVEATLAELAAVGKEMDALGYDRDIFGEASALIRKLSTPVSNDEVEAMCARLETNDDDVSYTEVVVLLRKLAHPPTSEWNDAIEACDLATRDHAQAMIGRIIRGLKR